VNRALLVVLGASFVLLSLTIGSLRRTEAALDSMLVSQAQASVGRECSSTLQCTPGEVEHSREWCLADSPSSSSGHCVRLHILP
jgi:hypothetical protein